MKNRLFHAIENGCAKIAFFYAGNGAAEGRGMTGKGTFPAEFKERMTIYMTGADGYGRMGQYKPQA